MDNNEYKSCCYKIDRNFALFIVAFSIVFSTVGLSIYKLVTESKCENATPYYSLLSSISGIAGGALFGGLTKQRGLQRPNSGVDP